MDELVGNISRELGGRRSKFMNPCVLAVLKFGLPRGVQMLDAPLVISGTTI